MLTNCPLSQHLDAISQDVGDVEVVVLRAPGIIVDRNTFGCLEAARFGGALPWLAFFFEVTLQMSVPFLLTSAPIWVERTSFTGASPAATATPGTSSSSSTVVVGTFFGVIVGAVLAHLVGDRVPLQVAVVLVSLFLGLYLFRINYAFMIVAVTVMVSQLYVELGEFSDSLLVLRLEETAIGAGVAIATVLVVLPLHIGRVARVAARHQVEALADLIDRCLDRLADPASAAGSDLELRASARRLDVAYQALAATVRPMRTPLLGRLASRIAGFMATTVAARHYARNLLLDASTRFDELDDAAIAELAAARRQLDESIAAITTALAEDGTSDGVGYVRSAPLFARVVDLLPEQAVPERTLPGRALPGRALPGRALPGQALPGQALLSRPQLALRDLELLDCALAEAARWAGVPVTEAGQPRRA